MKMETAPIGFVVVIKRNGTDGPKFPIKSSTNKLTFGRDETTDIRVQLPGVGLKHCQLNINDGKIVLENLSDNLPTTCNKIRVEKTKLLSHKDVFSIADRSFRVEYSVNPDSTSPKTELHDEIPFCDKTFDTFTPMKKKAKEQYTPDHFNNSEVVDKVVRRSPRILDKENKIPDKIINTPKSLLKRTSLSTKKRVSFGVLLSPEYFDKRLPPSTPIRRGASPGHRLLRSEPFIQRPLLLPEQNGSTNENDISCNTDAGQGDLDNLLMSSILSFDSDSNIDIFDDSPATKSKLPAPIQAEVVKTWKTNLLPPVTEEQEPTPQRSKKRALKTPLRKAIESKPTLRKTLRRGLTTPTRKQIMQGFNLKKTLKKRIDLSIIDVPNNEQHPNSNLPESKKLDTPLENQIACNLTQFSFTKSSSLQQQNINDVFQHETNMKLLTPLRQQLSQDAIFQETKRKLKTPLKNQINQGVSLHKAKKEQTPPIAEVGDDVLVCEMKTKIQTPLKKQIAEGLLLHPIKKKLQTPLRKQIMLGKSLRLTKMKLQTPLKKQISEGLLLRQTKRKLRAELRKQIKKGIALRETKKKLQTPLKKQISEGLLLRQTKRKLQTPLRNQIKGGVSLRQTMKKLQTPLKKQINEGLLLRQTKRKLQTPLRNQIKGGMSLRQTMKKMQTPLKKQINEGLLLRQTKRKLQTPLRNQIKGGMSLRQTMKKMQTPLKKQINEGLLLRQTKRKLQTPLRNQIKGGVSLRQTMKKLQTPLKKQINEGLLLRQTKRKLQTPLRNQIKRGVSLRQTMKKLQTPLKKQINEGLLLRQTKRKLQTPLRNQIIGGVSLRQTMKKLQTPLKKQINEGLLLRQTKRKLQTPLRNQIKGGMSLRQTMKKMQTPLKKQINEGLLLRQTKRKLQTPLRNQIKGGVSLRQTMKKLQTPLKKQINEGLLLRQTKRKLQTPLRNQIIGGVSLRQTMKKLQTPLKKQINEGLLLRQTKRKLQTPLRNQIRGGVSLRQTMKKLQTPLKKQINEGLLLRQTKRKLQTPLRNQIKGGVSLRQTMKKMQTPLKKQINEGLLLRQTKRKLQTPLRNQIKGGVSLRQTMKKMQTPLKKQINEGLLLRQTKRKLQTPLRNQIKGGVSLRQTMKKLQTPLKKQINEGLLLRQTKRKLQIPLRNQIKGGVSLRQTMKKMQTPLKKQISDGLLLRQTKRKLQTPLRNQIKGGMSLRQNVKKLQASLKKKTQKGTRLQNSNHLQANSYKKLKAQQTFPHVTNPILDADLVSLAENSQKNINMSPTQKYTKKRSTLYNKCKTDKEIKFDTNNDVDFHLSSSIKSDTTIRVISDGHFHLFSKYDEPGEEKLALEVNEKFVADNLKFSLNPDFTQTNGEAIIIPQHSNISHDSKFEISLHLENQNPIKFTNKEVSPLSEDSSLNDLDEQSSCTNNLPTQTVLNTKEHNVKANMQFHNSLNFPNEISSCSYRLPNVSYGQCEELKADLVEDLNVKKTSSEIFSKHDEQITSKSYQVGFDPMNEVVLTENSELLLKNSTQNTEISGQYSELSAVTNLLQKPEVKNVHKKSDFTKVRTSTNNSGLVKCPVIRSNVREGNDCSNFSLVASNFSLVASKENEFVEDLEVNSVFKNSSASDVKFGESVSCTSTLHEILDLPTKSLNFENSGSDIFLDIDNSIYIEQSTFIQDLSESKISLTKDSLEEFVNTSVSESPLQEISASQVLPSVLNSNAMLTVNFPRSGTLPGGLISGTQLENKFEQVKSVLFEEKIKHRVNINQNVQELNTKNNEEQSSQLFEQLNQNLNDPLKSSPKPYTLSAQTKRKSKHKTCKFQLESSNFQLETNNLQNSINEEFVLSSLKDINTKSDTRIEIGASNKVLPTKRSTRAKNIHNEIISDIAKSVTVNQTKRDQLKEKNEVVKTSLSDSTDMASKKALKERSFNSSETLTKTLDLPAKRVAKQVAERKIVDLKKSKKLKNEKDNVDKSETTKCTNDIHDNNITSKNSEHGGKLESVESCSKIYSTRARNALNNKTASDVININSQSVIDQNNKQVVELKDEIFKSPLTHITHSAKSTSVIHPISDDQLTIPQFSDELMNETNFGSELNFLSSGAKIIKDKKMENQVINFANQPEQPQALSTNTHNIIKRSTRSKQLNDCNSDRVTEKEISSSKENVQNVGLAVINQAKCSHLKKDTKNAHSKSTTVSNDEKSAFVRSTRSSKLKERETMSQIEVLEKTENNESNSNHVKHLVNLEKAQTNINNDVITCLTSVRRSNRSRKAEPAIEGNLNPGNEEYFSETGSRHNKEVIFDKNVLFAPSPTKKTKKSEEKMNECSRSPKSYDVSGVKFLLGNVALPTRRSTRRKRVCDVNANKKSLNQNQSVQSGFLINNDLDGNNKSLKSNSSQPNNTEIVIRTTSSPNKMEKTCLDRSTRTRKAKSSNPTTIHETVCESNHNNNTNADEVVTCSPRNLRRRKKNKDPDMPLIETEKKHRRTTKDNPECLDSEETKVPLISQNLSYELQLTDQSGLVLKNDLFNVNEDVSKTRRNKSKVVPENSVDRSNRKKR